MRRFEKFLFFYSILTITLLFVSSVFFLDKPQNLINGALLIPLVFYFWLKLTSPDAVDAARWSLRFLIVITVLTGLGIFGFYLASSRPKSRPPDTAASLQELTDKINQLKESEADSAQISQELIKIKEELTKIRRLNQIQNQDEGLTDILTATESPTPKTK